MLVWINGNSSPLEKKNYYSNGNGTNSRQSEPQWESWGKLVHAHFTNREKKGMALKQNPGLSRLPLGTRPPSY